jgi:CMP-N-acetylneuraminic acid synthetase
MIRKFSKTIALIPLRGGSKSIPNKNIKILFEKPLAYWVLLASKNSLLIDDIYVSTDSEEIANTVTAMNLGVNIIFRPLEYATDEASTESVMLHFMSKIDFDVLVTIQATSPLLTGINIDDAITQFQLLKFDSMLSAVRAKRFFWSDDGKAINYDPLHRPRRQDFLGTLMENGAFYLTKREILERFQCRLGGNIGIYEMNASTAVEIDEPEDWDFVERLLMQRQIGRNTL